MPNRALHDALPIAQGRRFRCTACGNCCRQPGVVEFSRVEVRRAADALGLSASGFRAAFRLEYARNAEAYVLEAGPDGCPLLADDACSIHAARPTQCRTFPFWDELLDSAEAWEATKSYCPGLDDPEGEHFPKSQIVTLRRGRGQC